MNEMDGMKEYEMHLECECWRGDAERVCITLSVVDC